MKEPSKGFDLFITNALEDKNFADQLAYFLIDAGLNLWQGMPAVTNDDELTAKINDGLLHTDAGIIILSKSFLSKATRAQIIEALNKKRQGKKLIPVWHDIAHRDVEDIVRQLSDSSAASIEENSLDQIIDDIFKEISTPGKKGNISSAPIDLVTINNTRLITLPLKPYNDWAVAISQHPVTNKQYGNFLKNVKSDILDEIIYNHVSETINVNYLKSNFHKPCGKLMEDGKENEVFYPHEDERFNKPDCPVVCVSLIEAIGYVSWLNSILNFSGFIFTLIGPGLWRYAAFGTATHHTYAIDEITQANMVHRSLNPLPVSKTAERSNALGLSDMFGNVWEWCEPEVMGDAENEDHSSLKQIKTVAEIAGGGYPYDLEHISPFLSSEMLDNEIFTKRSDLGFRIAALVNIKNMEPKVKEQLAAYTDSATPFVEQYFNRNYKYY